MYTYTWLCASVLPLGHYVVEGAESNWYLLNINIYSLSEKKYIQKYFCHTKEGMLSYSLETLHLTICHTIVSHVLKDL
jgi:hypothetical protein